mmetsp:Transcript_25636/g.45265  ORF Transcript_25636/g.45265 Transcript_25636/m.45265 type:complete len:191 (-) Transcript_25636:94-666(-)
MPSRTLASAGLRTLSFESRTPRRRKPPPEGFLRIWVLLPRSERIELEVSATETPADIQCRLGEVGGQPEGLDAQRRDDVAREVRVLFNGVPLRSDSSLEAAGVRDGSEVRVIPALRNLRHGHVHSAPRGLLITPGIRPFAPGLARGPREFFIYEVDGPYSANLQHKDLTPHPPMAPVKDGPMRFVSADKS